MEKFVIVFVEKENVKRKKLTRENLLSRNFPHSLFTRHVFHSLKKTENKLTNKSNTLLFSEAQRRIHSVQREKFTFNYKHRHNTAGASRVSDLFEYIYCPKIL